MNALQFLQLAPDARSMIQSQCGHLLPGTNCVSSKIISEEIWSEFEKQFEDRGLDLKSHLSTGPTKFTKLQAKAILAKRLKLESGLFWPGYAKGIDYQPGIYPSPQHEVITRVLEEAVKQGIDLTKD